MWPPGSWRVVFAFDAQYWPGGPKIGILKNIEKRRSRVPRPFLARFGSGLGLGSQPKLKVKTVVGPEPLGGHSFAIIGCRCHNKQSHIPVLIFGQRGGKTGENWGMGVAQQAKYSIRFLCTTSAILHTVPMPPIWFKRWVGSQPGKYSPSALGVTSRAKYVNTPKVYFRGGNWA